MNDSRPCPELVSKYTEAYLVVTALESMSLVAEFPRDAGTRFGAVVDGFLEGPNVVLDES